MYERKEQKQNISRVIGKTIPKSIQRFERTHTLQLEHYPEEGTTSISGGCKSKYGNKPIDQEKWTFTVGRKGSGDSHAALIMEGWFDHKDWQEHWAQMAHWVPQKIDGREAMMNEMKSGTISGRVLEKWEGSMVGIQERNQNKPYEALSAFHDFDQYQDTSTFTISSFNGEQAQREIANDKLNPPKFHFYGLGENSYNCSSWVSKIGQRANLNLPSEEHFNSFFQLFGVPEFLYRPNKLIKGAKKPLEHKSVSIQTDTPIAEKAEDIRMGVDEQPPAHDCQ